MEKAFKDRESTNESEFSKVVFPFNNLEKKMRIRVVSAKDP